MSGVIHLNAASGNGPAPSTYGWNLYADISTGCDELSPSPFIRYCASFRDFKEQNLKMQLL